MSYDDFYGYEIWDKKPKWDRRDGFAVDDDVRPINWPRYVDIVELLGHALNHKEVCKITIERL